jgi:hypothetical protein
LAYRRDTELRIGYSMGLESQRKETLEEEVGTLC